MELIINETDGHCAIGALAIEHIQPSLTTQSLDDMRFELEAKLRESYSGVSRAQLKALPPIDSYVKYYKGFGYSYHVLSQLESVAKGKNIPSALPLVEAMFMAELKNELLTAGHDLDALSLPLRARLCTGEESFTAMGGRETQMVKNDIMLTDSIAPISSILRGPDARTAITANTKRALYIVYAPEGIKPERILSHLSDIERFVIAFAPGSSVTTKQVY